MRATRLSVGSRNESDGPGAWTEPGRAPVLQAIQQAAADVKRGPADRRSPSPPLGEPSETYAAADIELPIPIRCDGMDHPIGEYSLTW